MPLSFAKTLPRETFTHAGPSPTTIATDVLGHLFLFASTTATTWAWDQYHYPRFPISTRAMDLQTSCCTTKANATFTDRTDASGLNVENDRYSFRLPPGAISTATGRRIFTWPTTLGEATFIATTATEPLHPSRLKRGVEDGRRGHECVLVRF